LEAAVGFVGDGHFDEFGGDGGLLIVLAEVFFIAQSQGLHDFLPSHLAIQNLKHFENFGGGFFQPHGFHRHGMEGECSEDAAGVGFEGGSGQAGF